MKTLRYPLLIVLTAWLVVKGWTPAWRQVQSDFTNYYVAASLVSEGQSLHRIYDDAWFQEQIDQQQIEQRGKFTPFPPITALLLVPISHFPPLTAQRIWLLVNVLALALAIMLVRRISDWSWTDSALLVMLAGIGLVTNFRLGQLYLLTTTALLATYHLHQKQKAAIAGVIVGVFTTIKYFPVVFLPAFFPKHNKVIVAAGATVIGLSLFQIAFFGLPLFEEYVRIVLFPHLNGTISSQGGYVLHFQSLNSLLKFAFVFDPDENPNPIMNWPGGYAFMLSLVCALILGASAFVFRQIQKQMKEHSTAYRIALLGVTAFPLLPATATYHYLLLILPLVVVLSTVSFPESEKWKTFICLSYAGIGIIPYGWALQHRNGLALLLSYPRLWMTMLLFITVLVTLYKQVSWEQQQSPLPRVHP